MDQSQRKRQECKKDLGKKLGGQGLGEKKVRSPRKIKVKKSYECRKDLGEKELRLQEILRRKRVTIAIKIWEKKINECKKERKLEYKKRFWRKRKESKKETKR